MVSGRKHRGNKMRRLRRMQRTMFFARQMQAPDWMTEVPADLSTSWMMMVRPEGDRCLLLSDGGRVEIRRKNGYVHERYTDSRMPKGLTVLDVVCVESPPDAAAAAMETSSKAEGSAEPELEAEEVDAGVA